MNAMNPNNRINPPRAIRGVEWPEIYLLLWSLKRSILGPRIIAPVKMFKLGYLFIILKPTDKKYCGRWCITSIS